MSVHPVFGITQNLQDFCFFWALWGYVHVLPPAGRGEAHSDCQLDVFGLELPVLRKQSSSHSWQSWVRWQIWPQIITSSKKKIIKQIERRNVSSIFFLTLGEAGRTKSNDPYPTMPSTPQCPPIYLQRYCSSLLWHTSIMKMSRKDTQTILTVRTQDLFFHHVD